jgi:ribose transport system substrate-binding protein
MKRREFLKLSGTIAGAAMTATLPAGWTPAKAAAKWSVGFSQCTTLEPWRVEFNKEIEAEAKNFPDVDLIITDGQDKTEKQVADVENLIVQRVDVILISPKESAGLTGVVEKAIDAKIPVIVLDRNVDTKRITEFIGGDNVLIGRTAGEYAVKLLGGPGKAQGNVVEIWGGMGTAPAHDRHDGFHSVTDKEPGIKYLLNNQSGDWKQDKAYNIMTTALRNNDKIDLIYGHNDPMAYGAYLATKDAGRKDIKFILGIDGLPDEGVEWVYKGYLTATFLYATPGAEGLREAVKLLKGEKIPPVITLPTMVIDKSDAAEILKKHGLL